MTMNITDIAFERYKQPARQDINEGWAYFWLILIVLLLILA